MAEKDVLQHLGRQAENIVGRALHALDQPVAVLLQRVGARLVEDVNRGEIFRDDFRREFAEGDARRVGKSLLPPFAATRQQPVITW